jgi:hypothetical protein
LLTTPAAICLQISNPERYANHPMSTSEPDISLLSRLLRTRLAAGLNPLSGKRRAHPATHSANPEDRSSQVIGSLLKDARQAWVDQASTPAAARPSQPAAGTIQSAAATIAQMNDPHADPGDLSAFILETLNGFDWDDWVTARCDFPQVGPFVASGTAAALEVIGEVMESVFEDACSDGDDLTVSIYAATEAGSVKLTITGPFTMSLDTLGLIKRQRHEFESAGGALYTVRNLGSAGFEALLPAR